MALRSGTLLPAAIMLMTTVASPGGSAPSRQSPEQSGQSANQAPETGTFGFDVAGMDRRVAPGDDFVRYAVGKWIDTTEIPADRSTWGSIAIIKEAAATRVREIVDGATKANALPGSETRKIADYFSAFIDETQIERVGTRPLKPALDTIASIKTRRALAAVLGAQVRSDVDALNLGEFHTPHLMALWVAEDLNDATHYRPYLLQGGLGMPDREYYLNSNPRYAALRTKYETHVASMMRLAGVSLPEARARNVMALEMAIAATHVAVTESSDAAKGNTVWKLSELSVKAPGLDWNTFLAAAGLGGQQRFGAWQPSALKGLSRLTVSEPLQTWKDYLTFHAIEEAAPVLPRAFADEYFAFNGQTVSGTLKQQARWKRGVEATSAALGEAVGKLYVEKYFPPRAKAQAQEMAANILAAFSARLDQLDWMSPRTKTAAKAKLRNFRIMVGYPDKWRDYSALNVKRDDAFGNWRRASLFDYRRNLAKLGHRVDRGEWRMAPQTVNGLFAPSQNSVTLPAAILAPTFFDPNADAAVNYGALGVGLGHEVTHGFDDNGALFDAKGNLRNWWTKGDMDHFKAQARKLAEQYSAYEPLPGLHIDGQQTSTEDIADLGGLATAWDAYQLSLKGKSAQLLDGFTPQQRFFLSFAQNFRGKFRDGALRKQIVTDVLPPVTYRTYTVRNLDSWYSAFAVTSGQKLFLPADKRVRIW